MKIKLLSIILIFLTYSFLYSQNLEQVKKKLDSLSIIQKSQQSKIKELQESLHNIKLQIEKYETLKKQLESNYDSNPKIKANVIHEGGVLRDAPNATANPIANINEKDIIYVLSYAQNLYFKVLYNNLTGYISYSSIANNPEVDKILTDENNKSNNTVIRQIDLNDPKYKRLSKVYGKDIAVKLMNNELWAGMSQGMVLESIGKPVSKTSSNTDSGTNDEWTYPDKILYFNNGDLKKWSKK